MHTHTHGSLQILGSVNDRNELTHSYVVDTFMETYSNQVENVDEVFGDDSPYATVVKVTVDMYVHVCLCVCV